MQCRNCAGNEFRKTSGGNYKCVYCGTLYYDERPAGEGISGSEPSSRRLMPLFIAAVVISGVIAAVFITMNVKKEEKGPGKDISASEQNYTENGTQYTAEKLPDPEGEVLSVDMIPDSIGNHYFLVMCKNTGKVAVRSPHVTVRLYSDEKNKVGSGAGYAFMNDLNPGEVTPVLVLIQKPPKYSRFETEYTAELPFVIPENGVFEKRFQGEISDVTLKTAGSEHSCKLKGRVKNSGDCDAKFVQVAAVIFDLEGRGVGYGTDYVSEKVLSPGEFDLFEIYLTTVAGKPDHYRLYYYGLVD